MHYKSLSLFLLFSTTQLCLANSSYLINIDSKDPINNYSIEYNKENNTEHSLNIQNKDKTDPISFNLTAVDSLVNEYGHLQYKTSTSEQTNVGNWLKFKENSITIPAQEEKTIPFTINPTKDTLPGIYIGGISIENVNNTNSNKTSSSSMGARLVSRTIQRIIINIPGKIISAGEIKNLSFNSDKKNKYINFEIINNGNIPINVTGKIIVEGGINFRQEFSVNAKLIAGGEHSTQSIVLPSNFYFGKYSAKTELSLKEFNPILNTEKEISTYSETIYFDIYPWSLIIITIAIIALITAIITTIIYIKKRYLKNCELYTIKEGETIMTIAEKRQMPWKKIAQINNIKPPFDLPIGSQILVKKNNEKSQN